MNGVTSSFLQRDRDAGRDQFRELLAVHDARDVDREFEIVQQREGRGKRGRVMVCEV